MQYWTIVNNVKVGPMNAAQLIAYGINPNSLVWCQGMAQWTQACRVPELMPLLQECGAACKQLPSLSVDLFSVGHSHDICFAVFRRNRCAHLLHDGRVALFAWRLLRLGESVGNRPVVVYNSLGVRPCKLALRAVL